MHSKDLNVGCIYLFLSSYTNELIIMKRIQIKKKKNWPSLYVFVVNWPKHEHYC